MLLNPKSEANRVNLIRATIFGQSALCAFNVQRRDDKDLLGNSHNIGHRKPQVKLGLRLQLN